MDSQFFRRRRRISQAELDLNNHIRMLWEQHIMWTRLTIMSIAAGSPDVDVVTRRLLRNPSDFARALEPLYGTQVAAEFERLFTEHLVIAAELVRAAKAGDTQAAADAERRWYANADQIAAFLAGINPHWSEEEWRLMLRQHLALTKTEAVDILTNQFEHGVTIFDETERQALMMADMMVRGIVRQFPRRFL